MSLFAVHVGALVVLLGLSFFFSGSETALFSLRRSDLHRFSSAGDGRNRLIAAIMESPQKILVTILTGNLFVNMIMSEVSTVLFLSVWGDYGHFISIAVLTPVVIIVSEITPKVFAITNPVRFARRVVVLLDFLHRLLWPLRALLLMITDGLVSLFGPGAAGETERRDAELDIIVEMGVSDGMISREEGDFIRNVLRFSRKEAANVMIPRNTAVFISAHATIDEAAAVFLEHNIPRAPVYDGDYDTIVGILDSRELVPYCMGMRRTKRITSLMYTVYHYPSSIELGELLKDFLVKKLQMAIVLDEYGGTAGVVTLSGILSELMGRAFLQWGEFKRQEIRRVDERTAVVPGDLQIDEFNERFGESIEAEDSDTLAGYIIERLGHVPRRGETLELARHVLAVKWVRRNRVERVSVVEKQPHADQSAGLAFRWPWRRVKGDR